MLHLPCAPVALALAIVTQPAPPGSASLTPISSRAAEATPAALPTGVDPSLVHRPRLGPLVTGAVVFGVSYALAVFFAWAYLVTCIDNDDPGCGSHAKFLFVPLAGPLLTGFNDKSPDFAWATYAAWSLVQVVGTASLIYGAVGHDVPRPRPRPRTAVGFAPVVSPTALGLGLHGTW
jgi:hypothetical protein